MAADRMLIVMASIGPGTRGHWEGCVSKLKRGQRFKNAEWLRWDYPHSRLAPARDIAMGLHGAIVNEYQGKGGYDRIVLVGHSLGALVIRHAYLIACGADPAAGDGHAWAQRVSNIVLLAAPNRGVKLNPRFVFFATLHVAHMPLGALRDYRTSADYMTHLSLLWARRACGSGKGPVVTNLYAPHDEWVRPDDAMDPYQFRCAHRIAAARATHVGILSPESKAATTAFREACTRADHAHPQPLEVGPSDVVVVLHGIRTQHGQWTTRLASLLRARLPGWEVVVPKYGFMSALRFSVPQFRRKRLGWFKRTYLQYVCRNPDVTIHVVAHSNGTYILGTSIRAVASMSFGRVVLLASVLPPDFKWLDAVARSQVQRLRNERSCRDVPVAVLCSGLRGLGMRDIGSSGYLGFHDDWPGKCEVFWHNGGHGAALADSNLSIVTEFIAGDDEAIPHHGALIESCTRLRIACRFAPVLAGALALCGVAGLVVFLVWGPWALWPRTIALIGALAGGVALVDRA